MRIKIITLLAATATLAAACGPAPGSAEWCKGVTDGTIKPSQQEAMDHGMKCVGAALESLKSLGQ
jgi:ABC-type phosphate/phosphonate transport system substrate-binding protein